jgi:hypothetical protein
MWFGVDMKDRLPQMYLVERRVNREYMKLLRRLLSATVVNSLIICRKNVGLEVVHLKLRTDVMKGLLVEYSI